MEAIELLMLFLGVWSAVSLIVGGYVLYLAITDRDDEP